MSIDFLLKKFQLLSVNQLNAQIKLLEIWKSENIPNYPLKVSKQGVNVVGVATRADYANRLREVGKSDLVQRTCISDAIRVWNRAPEKIKNSKSLYTAKKEIKTFAKTLPI